jgi:lysyl endopeptidase
MLRPWSPCIVFVAVTIGTGAATGQPSMPPAIYRAANLDGPQIATTLLLPSGAAMRSISLTVPTTTEHRKLSATTTTNDSIAAKRDRVAIGFARKVPTADASLRLADLIWTRTDGRMQVAQVRLTSPGARAIRLGVVLTEVPATLEVRFKGSNSNAPLFGPYPETTMRRDAMYWSPVLEGETSIMELALPVSTTLVAGIISLPLISHLVIAGKAINDDPLGEIGQSASCEVDAACLSTTIGQQAATAINAVARMVFTDSGMTYLCTGTLLNDSITSLTPYFFTASHCIDNDPDYVASKDRPAAVADTINTYWFFQTAICGQDSASNVNFVVVAGGARLLGRSVDNDWALLRLNSQPPAGATFAAWNTLPLRDGEAADGIHHPQGDLKKISQGNVHAYQDYSDGSSFITVQWTQGITEAGSAGSGLFTFNSAQQHYELRGGLYGGTSACDVQHLSAPDTYSRFDVAFPLLSQYLRPNAGNPTKTTVVVEYYYSGLNDYFVTASQAEIQALDSGARPGWVRTGLTFLAYSDARVAPADAKPVCRFYLLPQVGDSHFYSADPTECAATATRFAGSWIEEDPALFYIQVPNQTTGACPANTRPLFRFLNSANQLHHRYTAEVVVRNSIINDGGWIQEGYGSLPDTAVMCSPTSL